ncbi:MAG: hypothetical protein K8I02_02755 [Candidatus Methylomirabilis sp.]|nr:hypothetical protein [Deltaproteobacteria bacterium]
MYKSYDIDGLRLLFDERSKRKIDYPQWVPFIVGDDEVLRCERGVPAGRVAAREHSLWANGRFSGHKGELILCIADAVFSIQQRYMVAVQRKIRPFSLKFKNVEFSEFCEKTWESVFTEMHGYEPPRRRQIDWKSDEGRIKNIVQISKKIKERKVQTAWEIRSSFRNGESFLMHLTELTGVKDATVDYLAMNAGHLIAKADTHVKTILAPYLGLNENAPVKFFREAIDEACKAAELDPFKLDQVVWYTESQKPRVRNRTCLRADPF